MIDLTRITAGFGLLDETHGEGAAKALQECGGPWQVYSVSGWLDCDGHPSWFNNFIYRKKPAPPEPR